MLSVVLIAERCINCLTVVLMKCLLLNTTVGIELRYNFCLKILQALYYVLNINVNENGLTNSSYSALALQQLLEIQTNVF